nr:PREDICTED: spore wall protein 2-like [Struthio camelus australis]
MGISRASGVKVSVKTKNSVSRKRKSESEKGQDVPKMPRGKAVKKEQEETLGMDQEQPEPILCRGPAPEQEGTSRSERKPRRAGTVAGRRIRAPEIRVGKVSRQREMGRDGVNDEAASICGEPEDLGEAVAGEAGLDTEERRAGLGARDLKRKRGGNGDKKQERRKRREMRKDTNEEDELEEGDLGTRGEEQGAGEGRNGRTEQGKAGRATRSVSPIPGRSDGERTGRGDEEKGDEDRWGERDGAGNGEQAGPSRGKKRPEKVKAKKSKKAKSERGKSEEREEKSGRKKIKKEKISEAEREVERAEEEQAEQVGGGPEGSERRAGRGKESEDEKRVKQEEEDEQGDEGQGTIMELGQEMKEEGDVETREVLQKDKKQRAKEKKPKEETKEKGKKSKEVKTPEKTRKRKSKEEGEEKNLWTAARLRVRSAPAAANGPWDRWEEEKTGDGVKWKQLEHKGPYFAPLYEPLPDDVQFYYDEHPKVK